MKRKKRVRKTVDKSGLVSTGTENTAGFAATDFGPLPRSKEGRNRFIQDKVNAAYMRGDNDCRRNMEERIARDRTIIKEVTNTKALEQLVELAKANAQLAEALARAMYDGRRT